jgi:hypothetical protein
VRPHELLWGGVRQSAAAGATHRLLLGQRKWGRCGLHGMLPDAASAGACWRNHKASYGRSGMDYWRSRVHLPRLTSANTRHGVCRGSPASVSRQHTELITSTLTCRT